MSKEAEEYLKNKINIVEKSGKLHVVFNDPVDLALILRKIAIHKHTRYPDDYDHLDDVMDCDSLLFSLSSANEKYVSKNPKGQVWDLVPFHNSGFIKTDSPAYKIIFASLKRKFENGPCIENTKENIDHRMFVKSFFAPYLITDHQAQEIVDDLGMDSNKLYGRAR